MSLEQQPQCRIETARSAFETDRPDLALELLLEVADAGGLDESGRDLVDLLLPAEADLPTIEALLVRYGDGMSRLEHVRWQARRFDTLAAAGSIQAREAALDLLASATIAGAAGWSLIQLASRHTAIDVALADPDDRIDTLEQEMVAPIETGLPDLALGKAIALGREMVRTGRPEAVRKIERVLHALGESGLAYSMEQQRKTLNARRTRRQPARQEIAYAGPRLAVVIAGGHPTLRSMIRADLRQLDLADIREFPSAWEGHRAGRHARDTLLGADLAVIIRRQIAHSTSDQIASAARALSVPVVRAETPTISAVRRVVGAFAAGLAS